MSRRKKPEKRIPAADPLHQSVLVSKFINGLMRRGKKSVAENVFYSSLKMIEDKTGKPGLEVFEKAVNDVKPVLEIKSRRVGGATYQVPVEVREKRRESLAIRWLILYSKQRNGKTMADRLADELISASKNEGGAIKKREDTHKMAEANKAFAHFKW
ncbi:MAG: 30S ribosomal protein S7 [bacterium]|nr:30S ribosomal protein S7 [bacterium]